MPEQEKPGKGENVAAASPLIFISHDSRDAELAEAFSKLLRSVSAGMLKSFRSSDKKGAEGIEFGDEWYKRLMEKLQTASDVVCLFTERSLDRPWILYEAGVAKGKMQAPVHGIALGVPLNRVTTGPFYQFQNLDDSEESLTKLVLQLARRVPTLEPDADVVKAQVITFKESTDKVLERLSTRKPKAEPEQADPTAKLFEELKVMYRDLPSRIADRLEERDSPRRRRWRRFHPMMFDQMLHMLGEPDDPIGILAAASLLRDDFPWLYEVYAEAYRAVKSGEFESVERAMSRVRRATEMMMSGPMGEMFEPRSREDHMMSMELPKMIEHTLSRCLEQRKAVSSRPPPKRSKPDSPSL